MLQYIINVSAIWLLSLLVFDLFLSKESFHAYNRLYLLSTFILGLIVPLYSWQSATVQYATNLGQPVTERVTVIKDSIATSKAASTMLSMHTILLSIYFIGVAIFLVLLIKEIITLIITYKKGDKSKDGVWTIVETGKQHSPYSAFRYVYISSKADYTPEQLRIIFNHEEQHGHLLHVADLLFMQLAKIVLWFHPLVYMYAERLSVVHEFQADAAVDKAPKEYGQFLIEQAILSSAPALSHSFNRSPIKKRILMLTRSSSSVSKSKMLLALPLIMVCILCFSKNAFSDEKKVKNGNKITYRGNVIELSEPETDTVIIIDPSTGQQMIKVAAIDPQPVMLNGRKIYSEGELGKFPNKLGSPATNTSGFTAKGIKEYILTSMKQDLKILPNGSYYLELNNIVINANGELAYFDYGGILNAEAKTGNFKMTKQQEDDFAAKISRLLNEAPRHIPATFNGNEVPSKLNITDFMNPFTMKDGKLISL